MGTNNIEGGATGNITNEVGSRDIGKGYSNLAFYSCCYIPLSGL